MHVLLTATDNGFGNTMSSTSPLLVTVCHFMEGRNTLSSIEIIIFEGAFLLFLLNNRFLRKYIQCNTLNEVISLEGKTQNKN